MRLSQSDHCTVLALFGLLLFGCIYLAYISSWFGLGVHFEAFRCIVSPSGKGGLKLTTLMSPDGGKRGPKLTTLMSPGGLLYQQPSVLKGRKDVITMTPWAAPIIWQETFDTTLIDRIYKQQNITVATTVFALGKYVRFLKDFLETAEKYYMLGYRVHYYVFTDQPEAIPDVKLGPERRLHAIKVPSSNRWQEITLSRMKTIQNLIETHLTDEADYIFCLDVDTRFYGHWGAETLGSLVAAIHYYLYKVPRERFTYERRPKSQAYIPYNEGDFYYAGAMIGGLVKEVLKLVTTCHQGLDIDKNNSIEAVFQEESHLNKYLLYNKPTKLLSPEYLWLDTYYQGPEMKIIRYSHIKKNYAEVRPNR